MDSQVQSADNLRKSIQQTTSLKWITNSYEILGHENTAYVFIFVSQILWPLSFLYVNENNFNAFQTCLVRGTSFLIFNYAIIYFMQFQIVFKTRQVFKSLLIRNGIMTVHGLIFAFSQFFLPQTMLLTIYSSGPIFVYIFDYYINQVTINKKQFIGILLSIMGVILTVNEDIILKCFNPSQTRHTDFQNYYTDDPKIIFIVALIFTFTQILWGVAIIQTKKLGSCNAVLLNFHSGCLMVFLSGLMYGNFVVSAIPIDKFLFSFAASGIPMAFAQLLFIAALFLTKNHGTLTMISFITVVYGYIVSIFRYNETPNLIGIAGSIMIVLGVGRIIYTKDKQQKNQKL